MREYAFKIVNVFAESHFGGNPLAVFPDAVGLNDDEMQQIARQFNLSETVFAFAGSNGAAADVRIFTPGYELPLAGHPLVGVAAVLQQQQGLPEKFVLNTRAKAVLMQGSDGLMALQIQGYQGESMALPSGKLFEITGIPADKTAAQAFRLNSGVAQILLQVFDVTALKNIRVDLAALRSIYAPSETHVMIYLWCEQGDIVYSRMFFEQNGALVEDSGTGSAAANLGAYYALHGQSPLERTIHQGDEMGRPNRLYLRVDADENIGVGGRVVNVGEGAFRLP
ncbi:PhzF family phenazine biosynthesis protein [Uruburuella testudinis]|uniref:PhzF family phenazine biosynthesis protein n=1 Tax=Uruburuella testudinis TaxID=1282863 RepID=A0ABY4DS52_9NEIS|nr:PhzF family phenazine biosynthesis protein [Uruburuella testudinis]UOO81701.1 PhzF family phenazine biosynthesis protein [Uruburuella testudinis]